VHSLSSNNDTLRSRFAIEAQVEHLCNASVPNLCGVAHTSTAGCLPAPGTGWADHQVALLRRGRRRLSVAILVTSSPSHAYGNETLRGVAARLLRGLRPSSRPR
jgi:hypothetical protein